MSSFQIAGIDHEPFSRLFDLTDEQLAEFGAVRQVATKHPGFPCRVSLEDAAVGEELLLLPFIHLGAPSPYRASGPIFVRRGVQRRVLAIGEVPPYVTHRLISVRAYDGAQMMIEANVCAGIDVHSELQRLFNLPQVAYVQLHNAKPGCFSCQVNRV